MSIPDYEPNSWTCSSNEALHVSLAESEGAFTFKPTFTYPIFGDSEQLFGYKDLKIHLAFDSKSLLPFLNVKSSAILSDDVKDVGETLLEFLPEETIVKDEAKWLDTAEEEDFEIPGEVIKEYTLSKGDELETYKIHKFHLTEKYGLTLHQRIQIFVLLFIEAGSYIDGTDPVWEIYAVYKHTKNLKESFVGFATAYSYWKYPGHADFDEDSKKSLYRKKISQFVILPPYQRKGHGKKLYDALLEEWLNDEQVIEVTVEDPSEAFDDLRDRSDLQRLVASGTILDDLSEVPVDRKWLEGRKKNEKMDKRQFERCVEMLLLWLVEQKKKGNSSIDTQISGLNEKNVRLQIKRRLFIKNRDALVELEHADRMDKLQTAYERLKEDYMRILEKVEIPASFGSGKRVGDSNVDDESSKKIKV